MPEPTSPLESRCPALAIEADATYEDGARLGVRNIAVCAYRGVNLLNLTAPLHTFDVLSQLPGLSDRPPYRIWLVSPEGGPVVASAGCAIATEPFGRLDDVRIDTLVVPGGAGLEDHDTVEAVSRWVGGRAGTARRVCAIGAGTVILAAAGLLDDRVAVSHWSSHERIARRYPRVRLDSSALFARDGRYWTTAGGTGGIDLVLALIEEDFGHRVSLEVARFLVMYVKRSGGDPQISTALSGQAADSGRFERLNAWIMQHLDQQLPVEMLAAEVHMSVRNFSRAYLAATGTTPARAVKLMRLESARRMLRDTTQPISEIARRCGFGDDERMRRAFLRHVGIGPREFRAGALRDARHQEGRVLS